MLRLHNTAAHTHTPTYYRWETWGARKPNKLSMVTWSLNSSTEFVLIGWPCHFGGTFLPTQPFVSYPHPSLRVGSFCGVSSPSIREHVRKSREGKNAGLGLGGQGPLSEYSLSLSQCLWSPAICSCVTAKNSLHFGFHGHQRPQETLTCTLHTSSLENTPPTEGPMGSVFSRIGTVGGG